MFYAELLFENTGFTHNSVREHSFYAKISLFLDKKL